MCQNRHFFTWKPEILKLESKKLKILSLEQTFYCLPFLSYREYGNPDRQKIIVVFFFIILLIIWERYKQENKQVY